MVIAACITSVGAEETLLTVRHEGYGEVITLRIDRRSHVLNIPCSVGCQTCTENIKCPHTGMTVGCEVYERIGAHGRKHLASGGIYDRSEVFRVCVGSVQVYTPDICLSEASGTIADKV